MPISLQELRIKGPIKTIHLDDLKKLGPLKVVSNLGATQQQQKSTIQKVADFSGKVLGAGNNLLFGSTNKVLGNLFGSAIESGQELLTGKSPNKYINENGTPKQLPSVKDSAFMALELYPGGAELKGLINKLPGAEKIADGAVKLLEHIPEALREKAIKQYSQALGATKEAMKKTSEKVVPGLLEKRVTALTRTGLEKKASTAVSTAGGAVEDFINKLPPETKTKVGPALKSLEEMKNATKVGGVVYDESIYKSADSLQKKLLESATQDSPETMEIYTKNVRRIRQILDAKVAKSKGFQKTESLGAELDAAKEASNAIRAELAKDHPVLAKLNAEYSFWKGVKDVVGETNKRTRSQQTGLSETIAQNVGAGSGFVKAGVGGAVALGTVMKNFVALTRSTAWRSVSAVNKARLADLMAHDKLKEADFIASKLLAGLNNSLGSQQQNRK
jgi:hypothetical protein